MITSGAGHDAGDFAAAGVPSAMIFVRNDHGSHNPKEAMELRDFSVAAGLPGIAITSPITARSKHPRLMEVLAQAPDTLIVVDNSENVDVLSQAATSAGLTLSILIDLDLGFGRTGVSTMEAFHSVAERVLTAKNLKFAGLQACAGHLQHLPEYEFRLRKTREASNFVVSAIEYFHANNIVVPLITGGGTGTHTIDGRSGPFTEIPGRILRFYGR
jgi:D-serine deaminase-like pyridoxal phosphate-dependent protein